MNLKSLFQNVLDLAIESLRADGLRVQWEESVLCLSEGADFHEQHALYLMETRFVGAVEAAIEAGEELTTAAVLKWFEGAEVETLLGW